MEISEILTNYRASVSATKQYACDAFRQDETGNTFMMNIIEVLS